MPELEVENLGKYSELDEMKLVSGVLVSPSRTLESAVKFPEMKA